MFEQFRMGGYIRGCKCQLILGRKYLFSMHCVVENWLFFPSISLTRFHI